MGDNPILFCPINNYYFHVFQLNLKLDCIFNNLISIYFQSEGFPFPGNVDPFHTKMLHKKYKKKEPRPFAAYTYIAFVGE